MGYNGVAAGAGTIVFLALAWQALESNVVELVFVGILAGLLVSAAVWIFGDAGINGLPRLPWAMVGLLLPVLGLALYLIAREINVAG